MLFQLIRLMEHISVTGNRPALLVTAADFGQVPRVVVNGSEKYRGLSYFSHVGASLFRNISR